LLVQFEIALYMSVLQPFVPILGPFSTDLESQLLEK
jgi:hypothetical protein